MWPNKTIMLNTLRASWSNINHNQDDFSFAILQIEFCLQLWIVVMEIKHPQLQTSLKMRLILSVLKMIS